ncbi:MAG: universal stress protein [Alphaproteobacteria bacterium]|nr:universal stress protein [Alphaproteobacteria bacterium]
MYLANTILVPVDFSETAKAAISVALQMADRSGGRVIFLHVDKSLKKEMNQVLERTIDTDVVTDDIAQREAAVRAAIAGEYVRAKEAGFELKHTDHQIRISHGDWLDVALQMVEDEKVQLVVSATHGGGDSLISKFLPSLTERLVHNAPCSVFVVKAEGFPYLTD